MNIFVPKIYTSQHIKKCKYNTKAGLKLFSVFIIFVLSTKTLWFHMIGISFVNYLKSLIIIVSQIDVFQSNDHKNVVS
jgi:hypothetical protein